MIFKDEPFKEVVLNGIKIKFDKDGVYKTVKDIEIDLLTNNSFYAMPPKMVEAYHYQQSIKKVEPKKSKKVVKDGDNNTNRV